MFCKRPFTYLEIFGNTYSVCCPSWVDPKMNISSKGKTIEEAWHSEEFQAFRQSINDGTFTYCNKSCPNFKARTEIWDRIGWNWPVDHPLETVRMSFDQGCNLRCPSCRDCFISTDEDSIRGKLSELEKVGKGLKRLELSGAGDPVYSKVFREWMIDFDQDKFPELETIHLMTNAQLFTEEFYKELRGSKRFLTSVSISIDACSKEVYEEVRLGGKWERLNRNLKFLVDYSNIQDFEFNFVIQRLNQDQIESFYGYCLNLIGTSGKNFKVNYQKYLDWGTKHSVSDSLVCQSKVQDQLRRLISKYKNVYTTYGIG